MNRDYIVDVFDLVQVASAYGTTPDEPKWDPRADLNGDGVVDIFDLVPVAIEFA